MLEFLWDEPVFGSSPEDAVGIVYKVLMVKYSELQLQLAGKQEKNYKHTL